MITTAALNCSRYCLLLSESVVVVRRNVGNSTTKRTNIHKCYTGDLICTNWAAGETHAVPTLYVHRFSRYTISVFHNSVKAVPITTLWTQHLRTVQYKSSQQSAVQTDTTHWTSVCPLCDYSEVQAKYRLNIALHFNHQPTTFFTIRYSFGLLPYKTPSHKQKIETVHTYSQMHIFQYSFTRYPPLDYWHLQTLPCNN